MSRTVVPAHLRNAADHVLDGPYCEVFTLSTEQKQSFLARVATGASMHRAASEIGVPFLVIGRELTNSDTFAGDLDAARLLRNMALEEIAVEQSTVGVDEVQTHQGRIVYDYVGDYELDEDGNWVPVSQDAERRPVTTKRLVTSNPTLLAILKANSDKYRERSELTLSDHTLDDNNVDAKITNQRDREKLLTLLRSRAKSRDPSPPDDDSDLL